MKRLALDVALLLAPSIRDLAFRLNAALPPQSSKGLRLDHDHAPHITLTQQFVDEDEIDSVLGRIGQTLKDQPRLTLRAPGAGRSRDTVWISIERSGPLAALHAQLMDALREFERPGGGRNAFVGGDARAGDVRWVSGYRGSASYAAYNPHITLGHAAAPPVLDPLEFEADTVAACQLGRFCTCMKVLRAWTL